MNSIQVLNIRVDDVTLDEALAQVDEWMQEPRLHQIVTVNPEFVMAAQKDASFARVLAASDLNLPDGANLLRAAERQGTPLRERVAGTDFVWYLCSIAAVCGWKIFLLGGRDGAGQAAATRLRARYPKLQIAGMYEGTPSEQDRAEILGRINACGAQILFVAYGAPAQEAWIQRNRDELKNVRLALGVGGAFDYIGRRVRRAPTWMQKVGLEWLFRLMLQPWRLKRQLALVNFVFKIWRQPKRDTKNALPVTS